jgi:HSP20 family protein
MLCMLLTKRKFEEDTLTMNSAIRWQPFRSGNTLQEQVNRLFESTYGGRNSESALTTWSPAVDIYETENELVLKADLPAIDEKDLDIRIENNTLTVRGERKFEKQVNEDNYLRVERSYGSFSRSFSLPNTINTEAIRAEYKNGVLTVQMPKRAESKPKQVKVNVEATNGTK